MIEILACAFLIIGTAFVALSSVGLGRFPDVYGRIHAATKSSTLGIAGVLLASGIHFAAEGNNVTAEFIAMLFMMLTNPVGGHMTGRAAYLTGVPMTEDSVLDEMQRAGERAGADHDQA